jgi:hypothetical protein
MWFSDHDLLLIEGLIYVDGLIPSYESMKDCLIWSDECPENITPQGYELLCDLWIARSFIHKGQDFSSYPLDSSFFSETWEKAIKLNLKWPGLRADRISSINQRYYPSRETIS